VLVYALSPSGRSWSINVDLFMGAPPMQSYFSPPPFHSPILVSSS